MCQFSKLSLSYLFQIFTAHFTAVTQMKTKKRSIRWGRPWDVFESICMVHLIAFSPELSPRFSHPIHTPIIIWLNFHSCVMTTELPPWQLCKCHPLIKTRRFTWKLRKKLVSGHWVLSCFFPIASYFFSPVITWQHFHILGHVMTAELSQWQLQILSTEEDHKMHSKALGKKSY